MSGDEDAKSDSAEKVPFEIKTSLHCPLCNSIEKVRIAIEVQAYHADIYSFCKRCNVMLKHTAGPRDAEAPFDPDDQKNADGVGGVGGGSGSGSGNENGKGGKGGKGSGGKNDPKVLTELVLKMMCPYSSCLRRQKVRTSIDRFVFNAEVRQYCKVCNSLLVHTSAVRDIQAPIDPDDDEDEDDDEESD